MDMKKTERIMNMKLIRKIGCVILSIAITITMIPVLSLQAAAAEVDEGWLWPVSLIKKSGAKGEANIGSAMDESRNGKAHYGLDITGTGRDIFATRSGTVYYVNAKANDSCGVYVILKHTDVIVNGKAETRYSWYLHMVSGSIPVAVKKGAEIKQGEKIGEVGDSAVPKLPSGNAHLHFGVGKDVKGSAKQYWVTNFINVNPDADTLKKVTLQSQVKKSAIEKEWKGARMPYIFTASPKEKIPCKESGNHSSYDSSGYCTVCKTEFKIALTSKTETLYTTKDNIPVRARPYAPDKILKTLSKNTAVEVVGSGYNSAGNLWYKLKDGNWIFSGNLTQPQAKTDITSKPGKYITINDSKTPNTHVFDMPQSTSPAKKLAELVPGTIVTIVSVEENAAGNEWGKLANRNEYVAMDRLTTYKAPSQTALASDKQSHVTTAANVKVYTDPSSYSEVVRTIAASNTAVNIVAKTKNAANNDWGKIKDGEWIYMGNVKEAPNDTTSTLSISGQTIPSATHTKGKTFICKGIISSNHNITSVTVGVYDTNGKMVTGGSATPNAKSYDIQTALDAKVRFDQLDSGKYSYRINATDASGKSLTLVAENFTVSGTVANGKLTVYYDANGGIGAPSSHSVVKSDNGVANITLSTVTPTRNGYVFTGWGTTKEQSSGLVNPGQGLSISTGDAKSDSTRTYYAQWETASASLGTVTIRYNNNGGNYGEPNSHTVKKDSNGVASFYIAAVNMRRTGYKFLGWRLEDDPAYGLDQPGQSITIQLGPATTDETLTYYAQWEAESTSGNGIFDPTPIIPGGINTGKN